MHKLAQQYIDKVKEEVLTKLNLRETVYHPATFKAHMPMRLLRNLIVCQMLSKNFQDQ